MSFRATLLAVVLLAPLAGCTTKAVREEAPDAPATAAAPAPARERDPRDPWEPFNRKMFAMNRAFDRAVFVPVARGYTKVVPQPVRRGVGNLFNNLQQPVVALNALLQGHPKHAGQAVGRFLMNVTVGVGGIFDVASKAHVPYRENDFGQTFALWGWDRSRYFMLPLFGASTLRDGFGRAINSQVSPINRVTQRVGYGSVVLYAVHSRASALPNEAFLEGAPDEYRLLRDVYFQRRACQIRDCSQDLPDYELPDELMPEEAAPEPR